MVNILGPGKGGWWWGGGEGRVAPVYNVLRVKELFCASQPDQSVFQTLQNELTLLVPQWGKALFGAAVKR